MDCSKCTKGSARAGDPTTQTIVCDFVGSLHGSRISYQLSFRRRFFLNGAGVTDPHAKGRADRQAVATNVATALIV